MVICYKKLWKLLIDKGLNKTDLQRLTGISSATITKLSKNETVNTGILLKISPPPPKNAFPSCARRRDLA